MKKIMTIDEVAALLGLAVSTVRRKSSERKKGRGNFPLPFTAPGCKCLWSGNVIRHFIEAESAPPVNVPHSPKKRRQEDHARKEAVNAALQRHRKPKERSSNND